MSRSVVLVPAALAMWALAGVASVTADEASAAYSLPTQFPGAERAIEEAADDLVALRRDIHRHPEVSGQEVRTAGLVAERMRALDLEVRTGVGGHGVVAVLRGAHPGPVVGMRADMDAVASGAPDPVPFRSETPGVRHVCGHDVHTAVAVGVATGLAAVRDALSGTVVFVFQPAEENATGARAMLADGAMKDPKPDAIFALHTTPLDVGQIGTRPGIMFAGRDMVVVTLTGDGDLEAAAGNVSDLIGGLTTFTPEQATQALIGDFMLGNVFRSSPDEEGGGWIVAGFVTTTSDSMRADARRRIEQGLDALGVEEVTLEMEFRERVTAGVYNDPGLEGASHAPIRAVVGGEGLVPLEGVLPAFSEDFGFFEDEAPGVMYWLGVSNPEEGTVGMPHSPSYVADEEAIGIGARVMSAVLLDFLSRNR